MNCHETMEILGAYRDGELDTARKVEIGKHMEQCPACSRIHAEDRAVSEAVTLRARRFEAAAALQAQVIANLRAEGAEPRVLPFPYKQELNAWGIAAVVLFGVFIARLTAGISRSTYLAGSGRPLLSKLAAVAGVPLGTVMSRLARARLRKSSITGDEKETRS